MSSRLSRTIPLILLAALVAAVQAATPPDTNPAKRRLQHLRRGINLSSWFAQVWSPKGYTKEHFDTFITPADLALVTSMGFDHVRLSVNPQPMFRTRQADRLPEDYLVHLDAALQRILAQPLSVVIDLHAEGDFKQKLSDDEFVEQLADFWRALATRYAALDPERVLFEVLNEPEIRDRGRWAGVQARLVAAIRAGAPQHTIVATGARWSDGDDLIALQPLADRNVIYNFHFYSPHIFTHQGATWGENYWHYLEKLPYPSDPSVIAPFVEPVPDPLRRLTVMRYGLDRWNAGRIEAEVAQVAAWGRRHDVPLTCNEFGVYRRSTVPAHRAAWLSDLRTALEQHGIGWTMWDYNGGFAVVTKQDGVSTPDEVTLRALGLPGRR